MLSVYFDATGRHAFSHQKGPGIFNVRRNLDECCSHEGDVGTDESAQVLIWKN